MEEEEEEEEEEEGVGQSLRGKNLIVSFWAFLSLGIFLDFSFETKGHRF